MSIDQATVVKGLMKDRARLIAYIYAIVRDWHLAEDLFQDVSAVAVEKHDRIADSDHLLLWARKAARNKSLEALRKRKYTPLALADDVIELLDGSWLEIDRTDTDIEIDYLRNCLETLSPKAQKVVNLKYVEGLSGVQIAELVGSKVHSVYVALTRAHRSLEACVQKRRLREEHGRA